MRLVRLPIVLLVIVSVGCSSGSANVDDQLSYDAIESLMREQWEYREASTAECMADAGFDYFPDEWSSRGAGAPGSTDPNSRLYDVSYEVDYAAQHGFGILENALDGVEGTDGGSDNPNERYRQGLSHSESLAYKRALEGEQGCAQRAESAATEQFSERLTAVDEAARGLVARITSDERFISINRAWKQCMTDRGWEVESVIGFNETVSDEIFTRLGSVAGNDGETPDRPDQSRIDQLFEYERSAAVDHAECWQQYADGYSDVLGDAYAAVDT